MLAAMAFLPPQEVADTLPEVADHLGDGAVDLVDYFESTYVGRGSDQLGKLIIQMEGYSWC